MGFDEQMAALLADMRGWQVDAEQTPDPPRTCPGLCVTAYDVGVFVDGNPVAYPHPNCPMHGEDTPGTTTEETPNG